MRSLILSGLVSAALAVLAMPEPAWAQGGNVGGTIGKKDKTVTGGNEQPAQPRNSPRSTQRRAAVDRDVPTTRGSCSSLVGSWVWYLTPPNVFNADGTVRHSMGFTGTWTCTGGSVVIKWKHGVTDRGQLSDDGKTMSVTSSNGGIKFQATRQ